MQMRITLKQQNLIVGASVLVALLLAFVVSRPGAQDWVKEHLLSPRRTILSKVEGELTSKGDFVTVLKVKTQDNIAIEVHFSEGGDLQEIKRIILSERRDGHMTLQGQSTNLALLDIDGDGNQEILAPTFDENLVPRLNIFKFNPTTRGFERVQSSDKEF